MHCANKTHILHYTKKPFNTRDILTIMKEISPQKLKEWIKAKKDIQIIDVREQYEFAGGHIDSAKLIPLGSLTGRFNEIDKKRPVVFVCRSGARSGMATQMAESKGFDAYNMQGGMLDWDE